MFLKSIEHQFNIRLMFEKINPTKRIVIDETNIILIPTRGSTGRVPNIRMN
jgi:hypothetical protein